jgi:hypothetical protein
VFTSVLIIHVRPPLVSLVAYTGEVVCNRQDGNVEFVYLVDITNSAYSGFASVPQKNERPAADWSQQMPPNQQYQVHFGCGNLGVDNQIARNINHTFIGSDFSQIRMQGSTYLAKQP